MKIKKELLSAQASVGDSEQGQPSAAGGKALPEQDPNTASSRRAFATLLGALGAAGLVGCGRDAQAADGASLADMDLSEVSQALTGTGVLKVADTAAELRTITGGTTLWIAALQGLVTAGDGGAGVFYWSTTAAPDDGWKVLNSGAGNAAGWRRMTSSPRAVYCTELLTRAGVFEGETVFCWGYYSNGNMSTGVTGYGDNGGGIFVWYAASTAAIDGGMVFGPGAIVDNVFEPNANPPPGRWHRFATDTAVRNVKWYGANGYNAPASTLGSGRRKDVEAIQACLNNAREAFPKVLVPEGNYYIDATIKVPAGGPYHDFTMEGVGDVIFWWAGTATDPGGSAGGENGSSMIRLAGLHHKLINIRLGVNAGKQVTAGVNIGFNPGDTVYECTGVEIHRCAIAGNADGTMLYGVVIDLFKRQPGNIENCLIQDSGIGKCQKANIWIREVAQPYNTVLRRCNLSGDLHSVLDGPFGIGVLNDASSCTLHIEDCDMQRLGAVLYLRQYPYSVAIEGGGGEQLKKLIYQPGSGANQSLGQYSIRNARYSMSGAQSFTSEGGFDVFAAGDTDCINLNGTGTLVLENLVLHDGYDSYETRIAVFDNDIVSRGCHYGRRKPFRRVSTYAAGKRGRTYSQGDTAQTTGGAQESLPTLYGAENGAGTVTISASATYADVTFASLTHGVNEISSAADYFVDLAVNAVTGATVVVTTPYVTNKTTTGFRVNLPSAPGAGNSVTVAYKPFR